VKISNVTKVQYERYPGYLLRLTVQISQQRRILASLLFPFVQRMTTEGTHKAEATIDHVDQQFLYVFSCMLCCCAPPWQHRRLQIAIFRRVCVILPIRARSLTPTSFWHCPIALSCDSVARQDSLLIVLAQYPDDFVERVIRGAAGLPRTVTSRATLSHHLTSSLISNDQRLSIFDSLAAELCPSAPVDIPPTLPLPCLPTNLDVIVENSGDPPSGEMSSITDLADNPVGQGTNILQYSRYTSSGVNFQEGGETVVDGSGDDETTENGGV
jgi:hypothetical protein